MKIREKIGRMKYIVEKDFASEFKEIMNEIESEYENLLAGDEFDA